MKSFPWTRLLLLPALCLPAGLTLADDGASASGVQAKVHVGSARFEETVRYELRCQHQPQPPELLMRPRTPESAGAPCGEVATNLLGVLSGSMSVQLLMMLPPSPAGARDALLTIYPKKISVWERDRGLRDVQLEAELSDSKTHQLLWSGELSDREGMPHADDSTARTQALGDRLSKALRDALVKAGWI